MPGSTLRTLEGRVHTHPWRTLGGAVLLGVWMGLEPPHVPRNRIGRAAFAMMGSIAFRVLREMALVELLGRGASISVQTPRA